MNRLLESGLRAGGLLRIEDPLLVERYNEALARFGLGRAEGPFHVDATGWSPEVAQALDRDDYLDPLDANRRFILVSPRQDGLPVLRGPFPCEARIFHDFVRRHAARFERLTLREAVYGEMDDGTLLVEDAGDLADLSRVTFRWRSTGGTVEAAVRLKRLVATFEEDRDAWRDVAAQEEMLRLARKAGDVRVNGMDQDQCSADWPRVFHTRLFGGTTLVRGERPFAVPDPDWDDPSTGDEDWQEIEARLDGAGLLESVDPHWIVEEDILTRRLHVRAEWLMTARGLPAFRPGNPSDPDWLGNADALVDDTILRGLIRARAKAGDPRALARYIEASPAPLRRLFRRAVPELSGAPDINRLVQIGIEWDPVPLFVLDKPRFYDLYERQDERMRGWFVDRVLLDYGSGVDSRLDKQAFRQRLFGHH